MILPNCRGYSCGMRNFAVAFLITTIAAVGPAMAQSAAKGVDLVYRQRTEERLSALDSQMRDLTGLVERLQFRLRKAEKRIGELEASLAEARADAAAAEPTPEPAPEAAPEPPKQAAAAPARQSGSLPTGQPQADYDKAYGLLGQGKFAAGEAAFREFLDSYPDHKLVGNARYWIAESLYARQRYQESATAFLEAWRDDERGAKAPDNLLKLGMSLMRLDKTNEACASFAKLLNDYRGAPARLRKAASRERKSLGCA